MEHLDRLIPLAIFGVIAALVLFFCAPGAGERYDAALHRSAAAAAG